MTEKTESSIVFNKSNLDALPFANTGKQISYYDTNPTNLSLRVSAKAKTFTVRKRVIGRGMVRITLGKYGEISIAQAALLAKKLLVKLVEGENPNQDKKKKNQIYSQNGIETLQWLFDCWKNDHIIANKGGAETTLKDVGMMEKYFAEREITTLKKNSDGEWEESMKVTLSDWRYRPFRSITRQEVLDRFEVLAKAKPSKRGKVLEPIKRSHQLYFKMASGAYNFIISRNELDINENFTNPFDVLTRQKKWKPSNVRTNFLDFRLPEFREWYLTAEAYKFGDKVVSDYMIFSLMQVARSDEAAPLEWKHVNFNLRTIKYVDTKNGETYDVPMTKLVYEILKRREKLSKNKIYVFEYDQNKLGHLENECTYHFENIGELSGKYISHHDLRRTWATAAQSLKQDKTVMDYCLKHKIKGVDAHYFMRNSDLILECLQTMEDFFIATSRKRIRKPKAAAK